MTDMGTDKCHLGLMSFASPALVMSNTTSFFTNETESDLKNIRSAVGATRWSEIRYGATLLINKCVRERKVGGFTTLYSGMMSAF